MYTNNAYLNDSHIDRKDKSNPLVVTMCGTYKLYTKQKLPTWRPRDEKSRTFSSNSQKSHKKSARSRF